MSMKERKKLIIIKTGAANLASVEAFAKRLGFEPVVSDMMIDVLEGQVVILPGVGSFGPAMEKLSQDGLDEAICRRVEQGLPTAGICLGMQLFFEARGESSGSEGGFFFYWAGKKVGGGRPLPPRWWEKNEY